MSGDARAIGPYQVVRELGRGAFGAVFEVRRPEIPRPLALKVMHGGAADVEAAERFRREGELLARLDHPNVVRVHQVERIGGDWVLVTELVAGEPLEAQLARGPLPPRRAATIVRDLAAGVAALHERGIVHRDLKPANVLVRPDGTPVLIDLGIARDLTAAARLTQTGALLGTPAYMAPEQADDAKRAGREADVYALGAILYALLAGRPPFQGASAMAVLSAVLAGPSRWPADLRPDVPRAIDRVVRDAMARDPGERIASARELELALARALDAPAPRTAGRGVRAGLLLALVCGPPLIAWLARGATPGAQAPDARETIATRPAVTGEAARSAPVTSARPALIELDRHPRAPLLPPGEPVWVQLREAGAALDALRADGSVERRALAQVQLGAPEPVLAATGRSVSVAVRVSERLLVQAHDDGRALFHNLESGDCTFEKDTRAAGLGRPLTLGAGRLDDAELTLIGCEGGLLLQRRHDAVHPRPGRVRAVAVVADARILVTAEERRRGGVVVRWVRSGQIFAPDEDAALVLDAAPTCLAASADGWRLAVGTASGRVILLRAEPEEGLIHPSARLREVSARVAHPGSGGVQALAFAGDVLVSAGAGADGTTRLAAWRSPDLQAAGEEVALEPVSSLAGADRLVAAGTTSGRVVLYRVAQ